MVRIVQTLRSKLPLLFLGGGAGAVFLANIVAKKTFGAEQFVDWAYLTSLVAFFFSFSLLGSEQLVVRLADEEGGRVRLPRQVVGYILSSFLGFTVVYALLLDGRLFGYALGWKTLPMLLAIGAVQFVYQLERVRGRLLSAQVTWNAWKLLLLPLVLIAALVVEQQRAEFVIGGALLLSVVCAGAVLLRARSALMLSPGDVGAGQVFLPFMLSLGVMAALQSADRIVLEKAQQPTVFAEYVYLVTILAGPFAILQSYFGFKEAVKYRKAYSLAGVRRDVLRTMGGAAILVAAWSLFCFVTRSVSGVRFDAVLWLLLGALSAVRCGYGVLSAALGVRGSARAMYGVNAATVLALALYALLAGREGISTAQALTGYAAVWAVRFAACFILLGSKPAGLGSESIQSSPV